MIDWLLANISWIFGKRTSTATCENYTEMRQEWDRNATIVATSFDYHCQVKGTFSKHDRDGTHYSLLSVFFFFILTIPDQQDTPVSPNWRRNGQLWCLNPWYRHKYLKNYMKWKRCFQRVIVHFHFGFFRFLLNPSFFYIFDGVWDFFLQKNSLSAIWFKGFYFQYPLSLDNPVTILISSTTPLQLK